MDIYSLLGIVFIHFVALATPGPDFLLVVRTSLLYGFKNSVLSAFGIGLAIFLWVVFVLFGLKSFFDNFSFLYIVIMVFGGFYMLYMSYNIFLSLKKSQTLDINLDKKHTSSHFLNGFFVNLSNPKAIFYFASIFSLFTDRVKNFTDMTILNLVITIESILFFVLTAALFSITKIREIFIQKRHIIDFICALIFGIFALFIFYEAFLLLNKEYFDNTDY